MCVAQCARYAWLTICTETEAACYSYLFFRETAFYSILFPVRGRSRAILKEEKRWRKAINCSCRARLALSRTKKNTKHTHTHEVRATDLDINGGTTEAKTSGAIKPALCPLNSIHNGSMESRLATATAAILSPPPPRELIRMDGRRRRVAGGKRLGYCCHAAAAAASAR